jgi:hypothetical protein
MAISKNQRLKMLKEVAAAHLQVRKTISSMSESDLVRPGTAGNWSGKDIISHLADWEGVYARVLEDRNAGKPESWPTGEGRGISLDEWNEAQVVARADWTLDEVKAYFEDTHDHLMDLLERLPEIDRQETLHYTSEHYNLHYDDLAASRSSPAG